MNDNAVSNRDLRNFMIAGSSFEKSKIEILGIIFVISP